MPAMSLPARALAGRCCTPVHSARRRVVGLAASAPGSLPLPDAASGEQSPFAGAAAGLKQRLAVDPSFLFKLSAEVAMDEAITISANMALRGANIFAWSLDSVLQTASQMLVSGLNDVALVWCLAPTSAAGTPTSELAHVFQPGPYTLSQRFGALYSKWKLYSLIGAATGLLSTVVTAVLSREASLFGAAVWARATLVGALHLGVSANVRYQLVNGLEVVIYAKLPTTAARAASVALRFANNCAGSVLWILLSGFIRSVWVI